MTDGAEQYALQLEEFLGSLNPILFEAEGVVTRTAEEVNIDLGHEDVAAAEDLFGIQVTLERIEEGVLKLCAHSVVEFNPPVKASATEAAEDDDEDLSKFDATLKKFLPKFDACIDVIAEAMDQMNMESANIDLEALQRAEGDQSVSDRQAEFSENVSRLVRNLAALEQYIASGGEEVEVAEPQIELLYTPPPWSTPPQTPFYFEVREGEQIVDKIPVNVKGSYLIGRLPICDIVADDATCSRQHAVVQYRPGDPDMVTGVRADEVYIYDLGSTSGTYVNGMPLQAKAYYPLFKGDILQFGQYACAFVLRDSTEAGSEPPEGLISVEQQEAAVAAAEAAEAAGEPLPDEVEAGPGESIENRSHIDMLSKPLDPRSKDFDKDAYKQAMIEKYQQQQKENEEILRKRREMEATGQAVPLDLPFVPERPVKKGGKKTKKKDKEGDCVVC
eukprot:TRINITY_DN8091_c0_g1_i1.p1 TRINITY_DN8091_c0_g1~~TRINITY_DN8091_c0_g1_i1.p1  ORF type:complete len:446 (-),score=191.55 TRINITY_DN8091_c0_g1_i1:755-2092(-)